MTAKQFGRKKQALGGRRLEKEKQSELSRMRETSRESGTKHKYKDKRHSDSWSRELPGHQI
jgi:hypothetical protein